MATLQSVPLQSGGRTEGMATNVQQKQVIESQDQGIMYSLSEVSPDHVVDPVLLGEDMWKQLKRVTIPMFSGDKRTYQNWKAAFTACVDQPPAMAE